jgi:DNA-binding transcriptional LysR family regulator
LLLFICAGVRACPRLSIVKRIVILATHPSVIHAILISYLKLADIYMRLTFKQLTLFVAVAKSGSLSQAAKQLYLSQSAASMSLAQLEQQLGTKLFERIGKRLLLNEQGKRLQPKAIEVMDRMAEIEQSLAGDALNISGGLHIGASSTIGNYLLPAIVSAFIQQYPQVKIQLTVANTDVIIDRLANFDIDIGFIEGDCQQEDIVIQPWQEDKLMVVAAPSHRLAKLPQPSLADLSEANWILREKGSGTREMLARAGLQLNHLKVILELGSSEAIKQALLTGVGISCLSKLTLSHELANKTLVELAIDLHIKRSLSMIVQQKRYQTKVLRAFQAFIYPSQKSA